MASPPRQTRGGGKGSSRDEDRLSDPLLDRDLARRTGGLTEHARRWSILPGSPWLRVVIGLAVLALLVLVVSGARTADGFVAVPPHAARVTDQVGMLTSEQRSALDAALANYERRTGSQIAVLLIPSTAPEAIEQYSIRVADAWKLGRKGVDDGVLLVVAKDNPSSLRRLRIEAGRGVQGSLTDAQSKRVLQDVIAPRFRQGDFYGGLTAGVNAIESIIGKERLPAPSGGSPGGPTTAGSTAPAGAAASGAGSGDAASAGVAGMAAAAGAGAIPGTGADEGARAGTGGNAGAGQDQSGNAAGRGSANDDGGVRGGAQRGDRDRNGNGHSSGWLWPLLLFGVFVILPLVRGSRRGLRSGGWGSNASGVLIGAALGNALNAAAHRGGGSFGGGGFGGGDFGGGGGFSGGGGTFDGGGASGDW
ncbi:TPM domain-containing protein [Massilia eburnea]|uniref:TPM domain-containing protein n=1 Tax=Massilia eburnea TaxID=1776165 RepID=UPI003530D737